MNYEIIRFMTKRDGIDTYDVILTHNDTDGISSAALLAVKLYENGNNRNVLVMGSIGPDNGVTTQMIYDVLVTRKLKVIRMFILDRACPTIKGFDMLKDNEVHTYIIDHHETNTFTEIMEYIRSNRKDLKNDEEIDENYSNMYIMDKNSYYTLTQGLTNDVVKLKNDRNISNPSTAMMIPVLITQLLKQDPIPDVHHRLMAVISLWDTHEFLELDKETYSSLIEDALSIKAVETVIDNPKVLFNIFTDVFNNNTEDSITVLDNMRKSCLSIYGMCGEEFTNDAFINGRVIKTYANNRNNERCKVTVLVTRGIKAQYYSEVAQNIFKREERKIDAVVFISSSGTFSVRSNKDISALDIARTLTNDCGGHFNACGGSLVKGVTYSLEESLLKIAMHVFDKINGISDDLIDGVKYDEEKA